MKYAASKKVQKLIERATLVADELEEFEESDDHAQEIVLALRQAVDVMNEQVRLVPVPPEPVRFQHDEHDDAA